MSYYIFQQKKKTKFYSILPEFVIIQENEFDTMKEKALLLWIYKQKNNNIVLHENRWHEPIQSKILNIRGYKIKKDDTPDAKSCKCRIFKTNGNIVEYSSIFAFF